MKLFSGFFKAKHSVCAECGVHFEPISDCPVQCKEDTGIMRKVTINKPHADLRPEGLQYDGNRWWRV